MKARDTLIFIVVVLGFLGGISAFIPEAGISVGGWDFYFITLEEIVSNEDRALIARQRLEEIEEQLRLQKYQDSLFTDSLSYYTHFFDKSPTRFNLPDNNYDFFNELFADFDSCQSDGHIVRILHYGDSQIEGDRISAYIRQFLQEKFGGNGPGLLPALQPIPTSSASQSTSGNIERYIISGMHQKRPSHRRYGALGQLGVINGEGLISVSARNYKNTYENVKKFNKIRLFMGHGTNFNASLHVSGKEEIERNITGDSTVLKVYNWDVSPQVSKFSLRLSGAGEIYGVAVDGDAGVAVDNIPFRGSSGTFFSTLDSAVLAQMLKQLNARLIIMEFGGNIVPYARDKRTIENYGKKMSEQIAYMQRVFPKAKIMFIGPSDMSTRVNGRLATYPHLPQIVETLQEAALRNGASFWNMYQAMGGEDSMVEWVRHSPALAGSDYIHFTNRGVEKIANIFCETLMVYYDYYRFTAENNNKKEIL